MIFTSALSRPDTPAIRRTHGISLTKLKISRFLTMPSFSRGTLTAYSNIEIAEVHLGNWKHFFKYPIFKRSDKDITLLNINLTSKGKFYLQIKGAAMCKRFAPALANLVMGEWKYLALQSCAQKPLHIFNFLDDIWVVWTQREFKTFFIHFKSP